jgi:hypothetical protein
MVLVSFFNFLDKMKKIKSSIDLGGFLEINDEKR